jgi:hypothetical protein
MIRYVYLNVLQPPAPFVYLTVRNPVDGREQKNVPAQVDSGADRTVLPDSLVATLGLARVGTLTISGLGGALHPLPLHAALVSVDDLPLLQALVVAHTGESWALLGRDVLNAYRLLLDGPGQGLEVH